MESSFGGNHASVGLQHEYHGAGLEQVLSASGKLRLGIGSDNTIGFRLH